MYIQPFPGSGSKVLVSIDGGREPAWSGNGRELVYRSGEKMMAVTVSTQPAFRASKPEMLFERPYHVTSQNLRSYDVTSDGRRFLLVKENDQASTATRIDVVINGLEGLKSLTPAAR